ncbi:hypothetical protein BH23BAC1_BH23BAC1_36810 [soil metagenome]
MAKISLPVILILIFTFSFTACNKDDDSGFTPIPNPVKEVGAVTPIGQPTDQIVTATIGAAGGSIISGGSKAYR